uniref:Uncharacterized protein n=1 Tax=Solanum lycopersicum TaxID=4081 RepID=A0A3Q7G7A2_SOLLC
MASTSIGNQIVARSIVKMFTCMLSFIALIYPPLLFILLSVLFTIIYFLTNMRRSF